MEIQTEINSKRENPSLLGMFMNPSEQFQRIKEKPKIWVPLIIVSSLYAIGMALMAFSMDASVFIKSGVSKDQAGVFLGFMKVTVVVLGIFSPIIIVLITSAIHLLIAKFTSSSVSFKQLFSMNTFILMISAIGLILNMAIRQAIGGNPEIYLTSLAGLLNQDKSGYLGSIEVFRIWSTILTAIGLHRTAQFSKGLAWTIAIVFFLIGIGFGLIGTSFQSAPKL
ncbi:YIP1 family protein [Bacillus sp. BRMEA1]|uniref:Yip1 family protein n=1 Tax=Neobacillus endophyticus TaxID=2738405 RepID=UPI0015638097|nr:Yip1 family protein [Neobacillus endophyticus]NRD78617.1 YIP1 family protein [Neobacillus endophyticus]